jgi:hypothetical protein
MQLGLEVECVAVNPPLNGVISPYLGVDVFNKWSYTLRVIQELFGKSAYLSLLHLFHYGETYASAIARDFSTSLSQIQRGLDRLESAGLLVSKEIGKTRTYLFNPKSPFIGPIREMIRIEYEGIPENERHKLFAERRRPRRKGKPVLKS